MAHYVASINLFQHQEAVRASVKVYRVFDYGARPSRPVWDRLVELDPPDVWQPQGWLIAVLASLDKSL